MSTRSCPTCQTALPDDAAFCSQCGSATATQILGESSPSDPMVRASASYESEPGRLQRALGPSYELGRLIGRGGYAEVFAVRDLRLKRELAVKVLRPDLILTPNLLARFRREAEAVAALQHPHIVPVIDVGEAGGICYILMPLVQGESVKAVLTREGPLPAEEARRILLEAASALAATHEAGVVHRDIKPENIMLEGRNRHVRLMDFGIAKAMDSGDRELTGTGVVVGTPQYMSPEQAAGDASVDHRTDQYSLAVVGYQMVSGKVPFEGETARAIITRQLLEKPTPLDQVVSGLPPTFVATLHRAMEKDPRRRFATIEEFAAALRGEISPVAGLVPEEIVAPPTRRRWVAAAAFVMVAAAVAAVALRPERAPPEASVPAPAPLPAAATAESADSVKPAAPTPPPATSIPAGVAARPETVQVAPALARPLRLDSVPAAGPPPVDCATAYGNQDWVTALARCKIEGEAGNPVASRRAASLLATGQAGPIDQVQAAEYFERAAREGDVPSQFEMGERYRTGDRGVPTDITRATEMYLAAAQGGHQPAFPIVARRFELGLGVPRNEVKAAEWYEKAARANDVPSQLRIAEMYGRGRGVKRSESMARFWYETAAISGSAEGQYRLAMLLFQSRGAARSDSAWMWLRQAASRGHEGARQELERRRPPA